ncbi:MAG: hypothetical protein AAGF86_04800 [Pseudomonadota bacterium]
MLSNRLLATTSGALLLATGLMWHIMPGNGQFSPGDLAIGQTRAEAETAFKGEGFFGRTCFGELAVFADRQEGDHEQHVMAFINETTRSVAAIEVQQVETPVNSPAQCEAMVSEWAQSYATHVSWSSKAPSHYSAGATQRMFLRQRGADGYMHEVWGNHKGAAGFQTCDLHWRVSVDGREQLSADGEWHIPGDHSVPFDPLKLALSTKPSAAVK